MIMKEKIEEMSKEMSTLSDTITAIEKQMVAEDIIFLQVWTCGFSCLEKNGEMFKIFNKYFQLLLSISFNLLLYNVSLLSIA